MFHRVKKIYNNGLTRARLRVPRPEEPTGCVREFRISAGAQLVLMLVTLQCVEVGSGQAAAGEKPQPQSRGLAIAASPPEDRRPTPFEEADLHDQANRLEDAIFLFHSAGGECGVGFVISRKNRLIVTAGHVADTLRAASDRFAYRPGTDTRYEVTRILYHPRIKRKLDDGLFIRSDDPKDGGTYGVKPCLDFAVLQLSKSGPELPTEYELASNDELRKVDGQAIALRSYSDGRSHSWPRGGPPSPTGINTGVIRPALDPVQPRGPRTQGTICTLAPSDYEEGASGSPLFLASGRVIAVMTNFFYPSSQSPQSWEL